MSVVHPNPFNTMKLTTSSATSLGMMTDEERKLQRIEDIKDLLG